MSGTFSFVSQHFAALRQKDKDHPLIARILKDVQSAALAESVTAKRRTRKTVAESRSQEAAD
jgi:hypothetical protein